MSNATAGLFNLPESVHVESRMNCRGRCGPMHAVKAKCRNLESSELHLGIVYMLVDTCE